MNVSEVESIAGDQSASPPGGPSLGEPPHPQILGLTMAIGWTLVIMILCWIPNIVIHRFEGNGTFFQVPNVDKLVHSGIFIVFAVLWLRALSGSRRMYVVGISGILLAILTEAVQEVPMIGRDATLGDVVADSVGVLMGIAIAPWVMPWLDRRELQVRNAVVRQNKL
jgi:hypothetical protein